MQFLDISEVAEILGLSERTVRTMCYENMITYYKLKGKMKIKQSDLEDFLERSKIEGGTTK